MTEPPNSMFRIDETSQVLYLTVGYAMTENGPGWFDIAALFCPFCGLALQSKDEIARRQTTD